MRIDNFRFLHKYLLFTLLDKMEESTLIASFKYEIKMFPIKIENQQGINVNS